MKVLFVCSGNSKLESGNNISPLIRSQGESLKREGVELDYFPIKGRGLLGYFKHIFILKKFLKDNQYDIIHAHYGLCALVAFFASGKQSLVVSFMGDDLIGENRLDGSYTRRGKLYVLINKWFAKKKYAIVIVKSSQMQKILNKTESIVLPNGVDFNQFYPLDKDETRKQLGIPIKETMILFVGDIERPEKNFRLAKNAVSMLPPEYCNIRVVHGVSPKTINQYYNVTDICLITSFHEGSPNVIKEAMACNCPIVSTDVGDVKWLFGSLEGCYLISFKVEDVVKKIRMALEYAQKKDRTKGRERITALGLDTKTIAEKIIHVYNKVLN